jgi:hypothetical protein
MSCKINFCVLHFLFWFVGSPEALKIYEGQKLKLPYISIWYFLWLQINRWFQKCKNFVGWRSISTTGGQIRSKYMKFLNYAKFWSISTCNIKSWLPNNKILTFLESANNLQSEKVPYRYIGQLQFLTFIWEFSIFKASGLPTNLEKKIKYAEMDFTSHHSFVRLRKVKKKSIWCYPILKKTQPTV